MILVVGGLASGKRTYAQSFGFNADSVAFDVHELVRSEKDLSALVEALCEKEIVTCADVGSGVVPLEAAEREWRDQVGGLAIGLAARADKVVRMVCGIPVVIKGEGRA